MNFLILSACFAAWTWGGFTDDPAPPPGPQNPPPPAPGAPVVPAKPLPAAPVCDGVHCICGPNCKCPVCFNHYGPKPAPTPQAPRKITPAAVAPLYRLRDATGKTWEHENAVYLREWVAHVNRTTPAPVVMPSVQSWGMPGMNCAGGSCRPF